MNTVQKNNKQFTIPKYEENAALQLVAFTGVTFIMFHFARVLFLVFGHDKDEVFQMMYPNIGLSTIEIFKHKWWTILSYGLAHHGFWDWITNMIWAYGFASLLQNLVGYKQVLPLFFYGLFFGGIFYLVGLRFMSEIFILRRDEFIMGSYAGIAALGIAVLMISPKQKLHLSDQFGIPAFLIVGIYLALTTLSYYMTSKGVLLLLAGGIFSGIMFALLIKNGYQPATWVYSIFSNAQKVVTPKEDIAMKKREDAKRKQLLQSYYTPTDEITQERIDEILDKINEKGYYNITREEKEILKKAGK